MKTSPGQQQREGTDIRVSDRGNKQTNKDEGKREIVDRQDRVIMYVQSKGFRFDFQSQSQNPWWRGVNQ